MVWTILGIFACCQDNQSTKSPAVVVEAKQPATEKVKSEKPKPMETGKVFLVENVSTVVSVERTAMAWTPQEALNVLYKGPTDTEKSLKLLTCNSTGAVVKSIDKGLATVQLEGGCGDCGSLSIYDSIVPTLKAFPEIEVVHLLDPSGKSQIDSPSEDARPGCLEP